MKKLLKKTEYYAIIAATSRKNPKLLIPVMYVHDEFVKLHDKYGDFDKVVNKKSGFIHSDIDVSYHISKSNSTNYKMDIKFLFRKNENEGFRFLIAGMSGDYGFNMGLANNKAFGSFVMNQINEEIIKIIDKDISQNKFETDNLTMESKMYEKKLRHFIQSKIVEFVTEQKILAEAEKEGKGKPTSGLKKQTVGTTHTEKTKSKNPPAKKVTDGGPENKTLADAEPTQVESENKEKKQPDNTEFADRGKYTKEGSGYKTECMGIELDVKGSSYADINHLYLLAQMRKALEGRGEFIKKVTVEMGEKEKEKIKESKEVRQLRTKIRQLVKEELKKKL